MTGVCVIYEQPKFRSVYEGLTEAGMSSEDNDSTAILVWHDSLKDIDFFVPLKPWQIINRIPCINLLCKKGTYAYVVQKIQNIYPKLYTFMPSTFILPFKNKEMIENRAKSDKTYIYKPNGGSQGSGIIVLKPGDDFVPDDSKLAVVQEYIRSYLIDNTKFDLRLYVLVASLNPLRIYVYRNGLARFCSEEANGQSVFSQLTNVTLNRANPTADISEVSQMITDIVPKLEAKGVNMKELWQRIDNAIVLTIISAHRYLSIAEEWHCPIIGYPRCFQVLGFDVLLDQNLNPWILEVNNRPSLDYYRGKERRMKVGMIRDAARIACPMNMAQAAIISRKWGWDEESWRNFINNTPQIMEQAKIQRKQALKNSLFEKAFPNKYHPQYENWLKVKKTVGLIPVEEMPNFKLPPGKQFLKEQITPVKIIAK